MAEERGPRRRESGAAVVDFVLVMLVVIPLVLGIMQRFWYSSDKSRERFVSICKDKDVQQLTFESYMNKELVRKKPMAHVRIFFKDMAHLLGFARV